MIASLSITNIRNLKTELQFSSGINVIWGDNGSGKSSILEAIHYMAFGRSFRASNPDVMIAHNQSMGIIHSVIHKKELEFAVAITREKGITSVKSSANKTTMSKVAALLPTLFIDCDSHRDYFSTSSYRRRLFDWVGFHVEPRYLKSFRSYNQALKQRNWALKKGLNTLPWDQVLHREAAFLHSVRHNVAKKLQTVLQERSLLAYGCEFHYAAGFDVDAGLLAHLDQVKADDLSSGRTSVGAHKADWVLSINGSPAVSVLSQGQQKIAYFKLMLAQYYLLLDFSIEPLVLVDDVSAELDAEHQKMLFAFLENIKGQAIVTAITDVGLNHIKKMFHVKRGVVEAVSG